MPVQSPNLDDLRYGRVLEDLVRRIPVYAPSWTHHNDSDPGIALLQLFSYLTEQIGYRLNRVPEKNHVALLQLLGVQLHPARPARTQVAFFLSDPGAMPGFALDVGSRVTRPGNDAPIYETETVLDVVPAQPVAVVATAHPYLYDLRRLDPVGNHEPPPTDGELPEQNPAEQSRWHAVAWDGRSPAAPQMARDPIVRLPTGEHDADLPYLWVGLDANLAVDAGLRGVTVQLHVAFDDDEIPDPCAKARCEDATAVAENAPAPIDWLAYYDTDHDDMRTVPGRAVDTTERFTRSGSLRFTVPMNIGPIPANAFADLRDAVTPTAVDACSSIASTLQAKLSVPPGGGDALFDPAGFHTALTSAVNLAQANVAQTKPAVPHPLDPALRDPTDVTAWLRLGPLPIAPEHADLRIRHIGFNVAAVSHAVTVTNELVGRSDGRPGQRLRLAHANVMASLELAVAESGDPDALLTPWERVDSLRAFGPFDRVYTLDGESGWLTFGDGNHGRIPPLVARGGDIVALRYRHGGGNKGNADVGEIRTLATQHVGLRAVVNFASARGGAEAETLEEAKLRARKELSTRSRAVTADDFKWIATTTPGVEVARAITIPLRRPLPTTHDGDPATGCPPSVPPSPPSPAGCVPPGLPGPDSQLSATGLVTCGPPLPDGPCGLDDTLVAAGVVTTVVVPDLPDDPEPLPTPSFLQAVCRHLNRHRLVTTEIYVVPPQYVRICSVHVRVRAQAGYARLQLQEAVIATLAEHLHVLRGGEGQGAPFGDQVHVADLIAVVFRTEGVARVDSFTAHFARTKSNAAPRTGKLVSCPVAGDEHDRVDLAPEETTSFDATTFTLDTVL